MQPYNQFERITKRLWRKILPVPSTPPFNSSDDICGVTLVPAKKLTERFKAALAVTDSEEPGAYIEFGVFNGLSMGCMLRAIKSTSIQLKTIGIDSFRGLPEKVLDDDGGIWQPGQFTCSFSQMENCMRNRGDDPDQVHFEKAWYDDLTLDRMGELLDGRVPKIIMVDCDAYSSARRALELVTPFLREKTVIFFDDWRLHNVDLEHGGEFRAFEEWLKEHQQFRELSFKSYSRKAEAFIIEKAQASD